MLKTGFAEVTVVWLIVALAAGTSIGPPRAYSEPPEGDTAGVLRVARSRDGRRFRDTGVLFLEQATSPNLVRLRNGDILALFELLSDDGKSQGRSMATSTSSDEGRSWSPTEPIKIEGRGGRSIRAHRGTLVRMPDRSLRLFFVTQTGREAGHSDRPDGITTVRAAVTRNGRDFELDEQATVRFAGTRDPHPTAGWVDDQLHLYLASASGRGSGTAQHAVSRDGLRFTRPTRVRTPDVRFVGCIVEMGRRARAYVSDSRGVRSLVSRNGRGWKLEPGIRLADAWDPAVIRLRKGSFLMLYSTWAYEEPPPGVQVADASGYESFAYDEAGTTIPTDTYAEIDDESIDNEFDEDWLDDDGTTSESDEGAAGPGPGDDEFEDSHREGPDAPVLTAVAADTQPSAAPRPTVDTEASSHPQSDWSQDGAWVGDSSEADLVLADAAAQVPDAPSGTEAERSPATDAHVDEQDRATSDWTHGGETSAEASPPAESARGTGTDEPPAQLDETGTAELAHVEWPTEGPDDWADQDALAFVPPPDFNKKIEYIEWYRTRAIEQTEDNAYEAYAAIMPGMPGSAEDQPEWPELNDMFNDREYEGEPAPWDPADHPEWESSNDQVQELLEKYREATTHEGYAPPPDFPQIETDGPLA